MRWSRVNWPAVGYVSLEDVEGHREHLARLLEDAPPAVAALATVRWRDARIEHWALEQRTTGAQTVEPAQRHRSADGPAVVRVSFVVRNDEVLDTADGLWRRWNHARVTLRLDDAVLDPGPPESHALLAGDAHVARGELEHIGGLDAWELRLLVSPSGELGIRFRDARVSVESVDGSVYAALGERTPRGWHGPVPDGWVAFATEVVRAAADGDLGGLHLTHAGDVDRLDPRWGFAALHAAAWFDRSEMIEALVARGATLDLPDAESRTPLILAVDRDARRALATLLRAGADPEARDTDGNPPIVRAAWGGHAEAVRMLAAAGADPAARGSRGATVLIAATDSADPETVRAAMGLGIDPGAVDDEGHTAADRARLLRDPSIASMLDTEGPAGT